MQAVEPIHALSEPVAVALLQVVAGPLQLTQSLTRVLEPLLVVQEAQAGTRLVDVVVAHLRRQCRSQVEHVFICAVEALEGRSEWCGFATLACYVSPRG